MVQENGIDGADLTVAALNVIDKLSSTQTKVRKRGLEPLEFIALHQKCSSWKEFSEKSGMDIATAQQRAVKYRKVYGKELVREYPRGGGAGRKLPTLAEMQAQLAAAAASS